MKLGQPRTFLLLLAIETIALLALKWNEFFLLHEYASLDEGSVLAAQHFLSLGLRPEIDFGYTYGLLPLLFGRILFGVLGESPRALAIGIVTIELLIALGVARIAIALRLRVTGQALLFLLLPLVITRYDNLAYVLEAAFLVNAFTEQLYGRLGNALALALAAALCKPAMGYVYGAIILGFLVFDSSERRRLRGSLRSPVVAAMVLLPVLAFAFGIAPLAHTLLPLRGVESYSAMHKLGFTPTMLSFLWPPGVNWHYAVGRYVFVWVLGGALLFAAAIAAAARFRFERAATLDRFIVTIAILAAVDALVLAFRYPFLLPIGLVASAAIPGWQTGAALILCLIALPSFAYSVKSDAAFRRAFVRSPVAQGLWALPDENEEWEHAMRIAAGRRTAALGEMGAAGLVVPGIESPAGAFYLPGNALPADLAREFQQLSEADVIILFPRFFPTTSGTVLDTFPQLNEAVEGAAVVYRGKYLEVRARPTAAAGTPPAR